MGHPTQHGSELSSRALETSLLFQENAGDTNCWQKRKHVQSFGREFGETEQNYIHLVTFDTAFLLKRKSHTSNSAFRCIAVKSISVGFEPGDLPPRPACAMSRKASRLHRPAASVCFFLREVRNLDKMVAVTS